ncbi:hypothetical protein [Rhodococcus xishaensis]|nr:hypothetical protein [Rhodococcus xishaensis]
MLVTVERDRAMGNGARQDPFLVAMSIRHASSDDQNHPGMN